MKKKSNKRKYARHKTRENRLCFWCMVPFASYRVDATYCTSTCRKAAWREEKRRSMLQSEALERETMVAVVLEETIQKVSIYPK